MRFQLDKRSSQTHSNTAEKPIKFRRLLRSHDGIAVALIECVGRLERPGQPLRCSAGASALPTLPAWLQGESKDTPCPAMYSKLAATSFQLAAPSSFSLTRAFTAQLSPRCSPPSSARSTCRSMSPVSHPTLIPDLSASLDVTLDRRANAVVIRVTRAPPTGILRDSVRKSCVAGTCSCV
jgi:hypothetical protein